MGQELVQELLRPVQPVAQGTAQREVVDQRVPQRPGHDTPPFVSVGQGRAKTARASWSTLA